MRTILCCFQSVTSASFLNKAIALIVAPTEVVRSHLVAKSQ
ncbi:MAG TPA: hypothetical protein V6C95_02080 [Coleofasciculaceae cyanobacterium]